MWAAFYALVQKTFPASLADLQPPSSEMAAIGQELPVTKSCLRPILSQFRLTLAALSGHSYLTYPTTAVDSCREQRYSAYNRISDMRRAHSLETLHSGES